MAPGRETRSKTGNSKPRVIPVIDTAPTITRKSAPKKKAAPKTEAKGAKPTGVTKKKAPKKDGAVAKVKAAVKKTAKKATATEKKTEEKAEKAEKVNPLCSTSRVLISSSIHTCPQLSSIMRPCC
jgi:septal ring-binding cell division protein DamX